MEKNILVEKLLKTKYVKNLLRKNKEVGFTGCILLRRLLRISKLKTKEDEK